MFIFPAHISSVKAVAASPNGGKWLATGSSDEIIKVWDLRRRKEIGGLMHHEGSITHLAFPSRSHLISASEDGTLCIFHARDWTVLRALKGHKGRVNSVAVHPSGKVALTVGKDRTLRMWDLMRGKGSASTKLGKEGELVRWNTDGTLFVVQTMLTLDFYTTDMEMIHTIQHASRIHDVKFTKRVEGDGELLLVAAEDKKVTVYDIPTDRTQAPAAISYFVGHENRVKAVDTLALALPPAPGSARTRTTLVSTISSDGRIRVFDLAAVPAAPAGGAPAECAPLAEYDSKGSRLTCLAMADGDDLAVGAGAATAAGAKRKRAEDDAESADEWAEQQNPEGEISEEEDASEEGESEEEAELEGEDEDEVEED
ncbi:WD40 repeat-like protein [Phanerochaete sordida]|uniref:WD40 repeat-like protein n=1 Tax=Phanerochaete sordida TaxID=48140 RepID=A0A9P3LG08_9APHY|nr:WD40 repeat-like protein [Phanerochaete sordida]